MTTAAHKAEKDDEKDDKKPAPKRNGPLGYEEEVARVASGVKTLVDAGLGANEAARIALEIWRDS